MNRDIKGLMPNRDDLKTIAVRVDRQLAETAYEILRKTKHTWPDLVEAACRQLIFEAQRKPEKK